MYPCPVLQNFEIIIKTQSTFNMSETTSTKELKAPEFEPPQACINRVIKSVLPESVNVTKDARNAFTRAAGVFIFYLTHCANDISKDKKRSTIYASDVLNALNDLEFDQFRKPVEDFLKGKIGSGIFS